MPIGYFIGSHCMVTVAGAAQAGESIASCFPINFPGGSTRDRVSGRTLKAPEQANCSTSTFLMAMQLSGFLYEMKVQFVTIAG